MAFLLIIFCGKTVKEMGTETPLGDLYVRNDDGSWSPLSAKIVEFEFLETTYDECEQDGER